MMRADNLENAGERIEIHYSKLNWNEFNVYQKSHYKRYEFARSRINPGDTVGDMACGTGYGSCMLSEIASTVNGYDIDSFVIKTIQDRYKSNPKVTFTCQNLFELDVKNKFDKIVSFETVEHLDLHQLPILFEKFHDALKDGGSLIFSVPYMQEYAPDHNSHHRTFGINIDMLRSLLKHKFDIEEVFYQNYESHDLHKITDVKKDFIICIAKKKAAMVNTLDTTVDFNIKTICDGHHKMTYRGVPYLKCPFDYVIYQLILNEIKPDLIIEIGTNEGGGALYMADILNMIGNGEIHTIDLVEKHHQPLVNNHPRIKRFYGGFQNYNTDGLKEKFQRILVIDDGSHGYGDVKLSLNKFSDLISVGSYFVVEDGIIDELGYPGYDGGPIRAIKEFLNTNKDFIVDRSLCDYFGKNATFNVIGYLKRIQ